MCHDTPGFFHWILCATVVQARAIARLQPRHSRGCNLAALDRGCSLGRARRGCCLGRPLAAFAATRVPLRPPSALIAVGDHSPHSGDVGRPQRRPSCGEWLSRALRARVCGAAAPFRFDSRAPPPHRSPFIIGIIIIIMIQNGLSQNGYTDRHHHHHGCHPHMA